MGLFDAIEGFTGHHMWGASDEDRELFFDPLDLTGTRAGRSADEAARRQERQFKLALNELRRQFNVGQENIAPFLEAGAGALPFLEQGSTVQGFSDLIADIMGTDVFQELREERAGDVTDMLAAGGLTRSGTAIEEAARIAPDLATTIAGIIGGNAGGLAGMGQASAVGAAGLGNQFGRDVAGIRSDIGGAQASGILGKQQASAQGAQNALSIGTILAQIFSDPSLKTNIRKVGSMGPLGLYEWDWRDEVRGTIVEASPTIGFMSTEVKAHFPEYVGEFGGFDTIDYNGLITELEKWH